MERGKQKQKNRIAIFPFGYSSPIFPSPASVHPPYFPHPLTPSPIPERGKRISSSPPQTWGGIGWGKIYPTSPIEELKSIK